MADKKMIQFVIGATIAAGFMGAFKSATAQTKMLSKVAADAHAKEKDLAAQTATLNTIWEKGLISIEHHKEALAQLTAQMNKVKAAQAAVAKQKALGSQFQAYGQQRNKAIGNIVKAGALAYSMSVPLQDAVEMESSMSDVAKVVDLTDTEFADMKNSIVEMSTRIPMSAKGLAAIVASAGQAGIAKSELLAFAEDAAKMGVAFDITAEQAGDMMAKWRTAFHMDQTEVVALADKINYLGNTTAASAPLISEVVTRIGPLGEVGGVASGEIAALGASMIGAGVRSEVAATGIKNMILGLTAGEGATKSQAIAFSELGLNAVDMAGKMQTDAKGAILEVLNALKGLDKERQAAVLSDLFGKENIGAIAPLLSNLEGLKKNFKGVGDASQYAGSMFNEYATRSKTAQNSMQLLENAGKAASIAIGDAMLPTLKDLVSVMLPAVQSIGAFIKNHQSAITVATAFAGALALTVITVNAAIVVYSTIMQIITGIKMVYYGAKLAVLAYRDSQIMSTVATARSAIASKAAAIGTRAYAAAAKVAQAAQWLFNAALNANPIGVVIVGIIALGAAIYWCYNHFEQLQAFCQSMWDSPAAALIAFITGPIGWLIYAGMGIIANWEQVKQWFTTLWDDPKAAVESFISFASSKFSALYEKALSVWTSIKSVFSSSPEAPSAADVGAPVAENAAGGIYRQGAFLTTFAETGPEAAIPINRSTRAVNLWARTGQMMGLLPSTGPGKQGMLSGTARLLESSVGRAAASATVTVNFAPQITVNGTADKPGMRQVLQEERQKLEGMIEDVLHNKRRLSYD